jgi:transcriptional regulator GlxA family with amidase domain
LAIEEMVGWSATAPRRADARLWELLWRLWGASRNSSAGAGGDPLVARATELIEKRLSGRLVVADLARELGLSHNQLTRRFRAASGMTVVEFIRVRRVRQATYLLQNTTMPIKAIASSVGLGDFHSFNKTMRNATGKSPRALQALSAPAVLPG